MQIRTICVIAVRIRHSNDILNLSIEGSFFVFLGLQNINKGGKITEKKEIFERKNRYKNAAKTAHQKITTLKTAQTLENKGKFQDKSRSKSLI